MVRPHAYQVAAAVGLTDGAPAELLPATITSNYYQRGWNLLTLIGTAGFERECRERSERRRQTRRHDKAPAKWRGPSRDGGI